VDITSVVEKKKEAMEVMKSQQYLQTYYGQRAEQRGNHARRVSGNQDLRYAEAFHRVLPAILETL
jgi:4-oxalomesaconate hydratase